MRVFFYSIVGAALLVADGLLLYAFPRAAAGLASREEVWLLLAGTGAYLLVHFLLRKPERMYVWAHEFSHLIVAKLFFRKVHRFEISSRSGGKVVIDRTNVLIDLAPYVCPLYSLTALTAAALGRKASPWVPDVYLVLGSFLFTMHLVFSAEGFVAGQPDLKRSGRLFSAGVVVLFLLLWIPVLLAPGTSAGWGGAKAAYRSWFGAGEAAGRKLLLYGLSFL